MTLVDAFLNLLTPLPFLVLSAGVLLGIAVGVLPGITAGMLLALTLPFTYTMTSTNAVILLIGMYVGGVSGGLVTATLMRIPGEPNAVMTTLDGYPLARAGYPGRALGLGVAASLVGGSLSWLVLVLLTPPLARVGVAFGPFETFALVVMALVLITSLSDGSQIKGLIAALFGMLVSMPGIDESSGMMRLTFGFHALEGGFHNLPVIIGVFALSQVLADTMQIGGSTEAVRARLRGMMIRLADYAEHGWTMLRSAVIGIWMGILPGVGATIASIVAYTTAKNLSKTPERFGNGSEEGIVASETANNATTGGTLVPVLALGIPGGLTDSILLSALMIHNLTPGPLLFRTNPEIVNAIMAAHLLAHLVMFACMIVGCVLFARMMLIRPHFLYPFVLVFCVIGAYALNNRGFDIGVMLAFGVIGFALEWARVPLAPFVIGLVLAPIAEAELRAGLMASGGDLTPLLTRPIAAGFLVTAVLVLFWPFARARWRRATGQAVNWSSSPPPSPP